MGVRLVWFFFCEVQVEPLFILCRKNPDIQNDCRKMKNHFYGSVFLFVYSCFFKYLAWLFCYVFRSGGDKLGNITVAPRHSDARQTCVVGGMNIDLGIARINTFVLIRTECFDNVKHRIRLRL